MSKHSPSSLFTFFTIALILITAAAPKAMAVLFPIVSLLLFTTSCNLKEIIKYKNIPLVTLGIFLLCSLSILWSQSTPDSVERIYKLSGVLLGGVLFATWVKKSYIEDSLYLSEKQLKQIAIAIIITCIYFMYELLMGSKIYHLTHPDALNDPQGFTKSVFNRGIIIVGLSAIPIVTLLIKLNNKLWGYLVSLVVLTTIFISESQAIQLGVIFFFCTFLTYKLTGKELRKIIYVVFTAGFLSLPFLFPYIFEQRPEFLLTILHSGYPMERLELWSNVSLAIQNNILLGHGIDTISTQRFDMGHMYFKTEYTPHPHNAFLQIWYEFGLLGVLLTTPLFLFPLKRLVGYHFKTRSWAYSYYMSILFIAFVSYGLWQSWWIATLYFSLSLARVAIHQMEHKVHAPATQKN